MSSTIDKIKAKVENVLNKDSTTNDPTGPHNSRLGNQADPRVDSDQYGGAGNTSSTGGYGNSGMTGSSTTGNYGTTGNDPTGPHDSRLGNKMDPRVDSDQYGSAGNTSSAGGYGNSGLTGSSNTGTYGTSGSDPTGPHDSRLANKMDPRVDSDQYGSAGNTSSAGGYGNSGMTSSSTSGNYGTTGSDPTGPHDSRLANKLDPRVDSDQYGSAGNTYSAGGNTGMTGSSTSGRYGTTGSDPTGPHDSRLGNKMDPRVDSDQYGNAGNTSSTGGYGTTGTGGMSGTTGGYGSSATAGSGNARNTAGPHDSDIMNKMDPRVDSDMDGSKTYGGNSTYQ